MTRKVYKSAMGKEVDLGALLLQNENVRAVGNMNVNARGDLLDSANKVIDQKNRQTQRQYKRTTNVSATPVHTNTLSAKQAAAKIQEFEENNIETETIDAMFDEELVNTIPVDAILEPAPVPETIPPTGPGGLAAAIARSRLIKQEKEKTLREKAKEQPIKRI